MELTRRDALIALAGLGTGGVISGGTAYVMNEGVSGGDESNQNNTLSLSEHDVLTLKSVAEVVYPSEVEITDEFMETYVFGRSRNDQDYVEGASKSLEVLNARSIEWYGDDYVDLPLERRDSVLRQMGVDFAKEDPDGITAEKVRYYVVNELLYALYTNPVGAKLVGLENPIGYPGGLESYQRGSME